MATFAKIVFESPAEVPSGWKVGSDRKLLSTEGGKVFQSGEIGT